MPPDLDLLLRYADQRDEAAFAELVRQHVDFVYATALRVVNGEAPLAEDVTQTVFTELAHHTATLRHHTTLAGWLHTTTRNLARNALRGEQRRRAHEQEAIAMSDPITTDSTPAADISWEQLRPKIDEAVGQLEEPDREAVLMRFFQNKTHREIGAALGLNENAARMRLDRALDKLHGHFLSCGITTSAALLATTLGTQGATRTPAPAAFAAGVAEKSLAGQTMAGGAATGTPLIWAFFMKNSTTIVLAIGALVALTAAVMYYNSSAAPVAKAVTPAKAVAPSVVLNQSRPPVPSARPLLQVTSQPHPAQSPAQAVSVPVPGVTGALSTQEKSGIMNNLRQLLAAAQQYFLDKNQTSAKFSDLVGAQTDYQIHVIVPLAGEDYSGLTITQTTTEISITRYGETVTYHEGDQYPQYEYPDDQDNP